MWFTLLLTVRVRQPNLLLAVRQSEEKLNDVEESRQILAHLDERRRRSELSTSTISLSPLDKLSSRMNAMRRTVGNPVSIAVRE